MKGSVHCGLILGGLVVVWFGVGCAVPQPPGKGKLDLLREKTTRREYWLYLPEEYMAQIKRNKDQKPVHPRTDNGLWPLVVSFHGMKPFDNCLPQALEWQQEADRYGYIMIAPQLNTSDITMEFPLNHLWWYVKEDEQRSLAIIHEVLTNLPADRTRVLSTSWSSGGYMAHYMMNRHPDVFSCLAVRQSNFSKAILDPAQVPKYRNKPVGVFWTQNDFAVCQTESRQAVEWYRLNRFTNLSWGVFGGLGHERTPQTAAAMFAMSCDLRPRTGASFPTLIEAAGLTSKIVAYGRTPASTALASAREGTSARLNKPEPLRTDATRGSGTVIGRPSEALFEPAETSGTPREIAGKSRQPTRTSERVASTTPPRGSAERVPPLSNGYPAPREPEGSRGNWIASPTSPGPSKKPFAERGVGGAGEPTHVTARPVPPSGNQTETPTRALPQRTDAGQRASAGPPRRTGVQSVEMLPPPVASAQRPAPARVIEEPPVVAPPRIASPSRPRYEAPARIVAKGDQNGEASGKYAEGSHPATTPPAEPAAFLPPVPMNNPGKRKENGTVKVILSRDIGTSPCYINFKAELPAQEAEKADFAWADNGVPICNEQAGGMVLRKPGEHRIEVVVLVGRDRELRGSQTVQIIGK
jgi:hypothetical protein